MTRWTATVEVVALAGAISVIACLGMPRAAAAQVDPWAKGAHWLTLRAGYAKSAVADAADGNVGAGIGFTALRNSKWSFGSSVHWELLGRFGGAAEIEVPWTVELTRHYKWNTPLRPYAGIGAGMYYHKVYRTGADAVDIRPGGFFAIGANTPVSDRSLLGADLRLTLQTQAESVDPIFPNEESKAMRWSGKLTWSVVN